jgi:uncharacterized protein (TIGR02996 family)
MNDLEAFLRAIAVDPADDTVRLAFADWLDERDDTERAEFIRLQVKLASVNPNDPRDITLTERAEKLLLANRADWLGPLADAEERQVFEPTFRRGFVEAALIHGSALAQFAEPLRQCCPALTELDVLGVRGFGERIANAVPATLRTLRLEDWPFPDDARAIAQAVHLNRLEFLSYWLGSRNDEAVSLILGDTRALPSLKRVELIQLAGGLDAFEEAAILNARADSLAQLLNGRRGAEIATVHRPFDALLPLAPHVGRNLHGGRVPDGRQVVVHARIHGNAGECEVFYFDPTGSLLSGEVIAATGHLHGKPDYCGYNEEELFAFLGRRIGFRPELIRVHEFNGGRVIPNCETRIYKYDGSAYEFVENPDNELSPYADSREDELSYVRYWFRDGNFCITHGGDAVWAGEDGWIHST